MRSVNSNDWNKALVEIKPGYIISGRTLMSRKEFEEFLDEHGYKLLKWEQGTNPLCG